MAIGPSVTDSSSFQNQDENKNAWNDKDSGCDSLPIDKDEKVSDAQDVDREVFTEDTLDYLPLPPDGGYGWVVCFGSFMVMVILDGMLFTFGVFYMDLLTSFGDSKGRTAMVGSALMGAHLIAGPFTSAMVNLWGIRKVAVAGSLIAGTAFALSTMAPSITILTLTYGVLGGIGVGMVYIPSILIVGFYFHRKRAFANGIGNSGSGIGTFVFAPLTSWLLDQYAWRGALLILAGIVFNCAVMSALFRPLKAKKKEQPKQIASPPIVTSTVDNAKCLLLKRINDLRDLQTGLVNKVSHSHSDIREHTPVLNHLGKQSLSFQQLPTNNSITICLLDDKKGISHPNLRMQALGMGKDGSISQHLLTSGDLLNKPMYRKDAFYSGSNWRIAEEMHQRSSLLNRSRITVQNMQASMLRLDDKDFIEETGKVPKKRSYFCDSLQQMADLHLLKNPVFLMCVISAILWTTHSSVLSILPDYASQCGISKTKGSLLLSLIGIANVIGRLGAGYMSDHPKIDCLWVNSSALLIGGSMCILIPFSKSYPLLGVESFIFGLCMATWTSLRPIILVELLGIDKLTNAFGVLVMFQGIAFVIGPPSAGILFDLTGSYVVPFICAGCAFLLSGTISLLKRRVSNLLSTPSMPLENDLELYIDDPDFEDAAPKMYDIMASTPDIMKNSMGSLGYSIQCLEKSGVYIHDE